MSLPPLAILQTCFSHSWGGLEMQALELSHGLHDRGHLVTLAAPSGSRLADEARRGTLPLLPLDVTGYVHPSAVWSLRRLIRLSKIDIVHCQHSRDLATVVPALQLSGRKPPLVLSKRMGSYIVKKDIVHRYTHSRISVVLAISDIIHRNVIDTTPVSPERVRTLHDAVNTSLFSPERVDRWKVRREAGIPDDAIVVGFVGRFSPGKGLEELLQAAHILLLKHPLLRFLVVGEGSHGEEEYAASIHALALTLGVQSGVTFLGFRCDVPSVMASFDILAFPSHAESFGVVLIEGMAMAKPVVSTNCDGVLDIVVDGVTGIMVPPKDAEAIASGLEKLLLNAELRKTMGEAGRQRAKECFDQEVQLSKLEGIYRELMESAVQTSRDRDQG
jgi:glycosyltransferase involved in cell wall biosynthesis